MSSPAPLLNKDDYILTFKVQGVSAFMTDVSNAMYEAMAALYIVHEDVYYQYFRATHFNRALEEGVIFYSDPHAFLAYQEKIEASVASLRNFMDALLATSQPIEKSDVAHFFNASVEFLQLYSQMDFEYTDKAFTLQDKNPIIAENLRGVSVLKDTIRAFINRAFFEPESYVEQLFARLGTQFNVDSQKLHAYLRADVLALFDGQTVGSQELASRQECFVAYTYDGKPYTLAGKNALAVKDRFVAGVPEATHVLQGQTANGTTILRGKVKVVPVDYSDFARVTREMEQMEEGDILVAETTAPELMLACRKAAAIVTDLGGLLSHAAIVSRELGIPCIVNTKHASQVLKDGDVVEIYANIGVIRKLS